MKMANPSAEVTEEDAVGNQWARHPPSSTVENWLVTPFISSCFTPI